MARWFVTLALLLLLAGAIAETADPDAPEDAPGACAANNNAEPDTGNDSGPDGGWGSDEIEPPLRGDCDIDRVAAADMGSIDFAGEYKGKKPLVVTGATDSWKAKVRGFHLCSPSFFCRSKGMATPQRPDAPTPLSLLVHSHATLHHLDMHIGFTVRDGQKTVRGLLRCFAKLLCAILPAQLRNRSVRPRNPGQLAATGAQEEPRPSKDQYRIVGRAWHQV